MAVCGLAGAAVLNASGESTPVVVATTGWAAGHVIGAGDVRVVSLDGHPEIASVSSAQEVIGRVSAAVVSPGTALTATMVAAQLQSNGAIVGISLKPSGMPVRGLQAGDEVQIFRGGDPAGGASPAQPAQKTANGPWTGTVTAVGAVREDGTRSVDVEMPAAMAAGAATAAGDGSAVIVLTHRGGGS